MKVAELEGAKLDYWVAKAEGFDARIEIINQFPYCVYGGWKRFFPSSDWLDGGPIIEREHMYLDPAFDAKTDKFSHYKAGCYSAAGTKDHFAGEWAWEIGETPLIAAMRAFVASKFGHEVEEEMP